MGVDLHQKLFSIAYYIAYFQWWFGAYCHIIFLSKTIHQVHFADWWIKVVEDINLWPNWKETINKFALACWQIWKARNYKVFKAKDTEAQEIVNATLRLWEETWNSTLPILS